MSSYRSNPLGLLYHAFGYYRLFKQAETWSRDQIEAYQLKKLQEITDYAYAHVPYYRETYAKAGFKPGDIKSFSDFQKLPYLSKETIKHASKESFLSDEAEKLGTVFADTSGSTGLPMSFACDTKSRAAKYAVTLMAYGEAGYRLGDVQFVLKNLHGLKGGCQFSKFSRQIQMHVYDIALTSPKVLAELLLKHPPVHVVAHPSSLLELGMSLKNVRELFRKLRGITTISEVLTPALRKNLEDVFGSRIFDYYSNTESSLMAYQMKTGEYVFADFFAYPEIEKPAHEDCLTGELVTTAFYSYAMPLIRYRNCDIVSLRPSEDGDATAMMHVKNVGGRTVERIILPNGRTVGLIDLVRSNLDNISNYQFVQTSKCDLELDYTAFVASIPVDELGILDEIKSYVGSEMNVTVRRVDSLRKTKSGKTPRSIVLKEEE